MTHRIKEVIVVEGRDDSAAVQRAVDAPIIETHGFGIKKQTWEIIEKAYVEKGIIILTDPDFSGEEIRKKLTKRFPDAKQAYLTAAEATKNGDIGVENAKPEAIACAIRKARATIEKENARDIFSMEDMKRYGLAGDPCAAEKRALLGKLLGIGYGNVKTFQNKLNRYGITVEEFHEAIFACDNRGNKG